jgi:hypothetical protein
VSGPGAQSKSFTRSVGTAACGHGSLPARPTYPKLSAKKIGRLAAKLTCVRRAVLAGSTDFQVGAPGLIF